MRARPKTGYTPYQSESVEESLLTHPIYGELVRSEIDFQLTTLPQNGVRFVDVCREILRN